MWIGKREAARDVKTLAFFKVHTKKDVCYKSLHSYKLETVSDGHRAQQCVMIKTTWTVCVCFVNLTKFCLICIVYASTAAFLCFDHARLQRICISVFFLLYYLSVACVETAQMFALDNNRLLLAHKLQVLCKHQASSSSALCVYKVKIPKASK